MKLFSQQQHPHQAHGYGDQQPPVTAQHRFLSGDFDRVDLILESPPSKGTASLTHHHHAYQFDLRPNPRVLGTLGVAAITFFFGCGGPVGSEAIVATGGPLVAVLAFSLYPLVFTIPYGAVVAELCSAFPEDGGFTIWVTNAFGSFWGLQIGYWSWVAGLFGGAVYPSIIFDLISAQTGVTVASTSLTYLLKAAIGLVLGLPTFLSTKVIGRGAIALLCLVYIPVVLYIVWSFAEFKTSSQLSIVRHVNMTGVQWESEDEYNYGIENSYYDVLNTVFWNYDGIQMASVFGGQVANPARVYGRAITITLSLTIFAYVMPMIATLVADTVLWTEFTKGTYVDGALALGGAGLKVVLQISTFSTVIGLYMSSLFCKAFEMAGMADSKLLPSVFGMRNAVFGSPHYSILSTMLITMALAGLDTETLVPVMNVFAALVTVTIFVSAIQLRHTLPFMPRPTKVPGGLYVLVLLALIPIAICGYLIVKNLMLGWKEALMIAGFFVPGFAYGAVHSLHYRESFP